ncbi:MAG: hypothetical protein ACLSGH_15615 [Faecalibacillus intestinalis]|uniref:DUF5050 domain-containing protein n=2 Tax=Lachnospiraceae TaxID=186803 RepID=A0AAE3AZX8_9FIRM|nr:hypothetical protein [Gallintestinimicrobium propionicum]MCC2169192.1 hypothetical protein [Gallintestinimicrobium propionicum]MCU6690910.1 hypothetical protein [Gallintestinimicrobium propionicum]SCJ12602.1 Uncharacterised protein [uncultured Clostridium sp.]
MKNEWLTFFFILIAGLLTSCSMPNAVESTVSVDNAEEDIILPDDIFEAPEYEYIINNPFNSYVKHFNETTYAATPDGLYAQKDDTKGWELIDVGCIGMGDEFNGDLYYSCDNLVKRLNLNTHEISTLCDSEEAIYKITFEQWNGENHIYFFAESGCVQEALLDENGEILELVPFDETTNYQEYNSRYRYKISYPESVKNDPYWDLSFSVDLIDTCFSRKYWNGTNFFSVHASMSGNTDIRFMRAYRFNFSERRGEIIEYGKCYDKCIATNWGLVFFDEHQHDRIHLMSLDGKREKILWNRNEEHFDFITFDDDYLYGFYEKDEKAYVGRISFQTEDFEILFSKSEDYEHFDILNDHIYYLDSNSQLKCQDIQSGEITYIG